MVSPTGDEPIHVGGDRIDVFEVFFGRVGVVEAEVAAAVVFAGDAEVETDGFCVADVEVAVGLRWKSRHDFRIAFFGHIVRDDGADKIAG